MALATDLTGSIWNAIADLVQRSRAPREVYFTKVTKADKIKMLVWAEEFGDLAIPLVSFTTTISYFDTEPYGNVTSGSPVNTRRQKREDKTQTNPAYETKLVCPKSGDTIIVLDLAGAKRFPICIGVIQSRSGFWEEK